MNVISKTTLKNQLKKNRKKALNSFFSKDHRLELVSEFHGKVWINDSKATDIGASAFSLENTNGPIIWIVGESKVKRDLDFVFEIVVSKVDQIIYYGNYETHLKYKFGSFLKYAHVNDIKEAVKVALENQIDNSTILFSPACTSFPSHENYKTRGDYFKLLLRTI